MSGLPYLSRIRLRRDAPIGALARVLVPADSDQRAGVSHRLLWTLFGDEPGRERDFLWRETEPGMFYVLSGRIPVDQHQLFEIDAPKQFDPVLRVGDHLRFSLRANATIARSSGRGVRGKPCDVVMDALYRIPKEARAEQRKVHVGSAGKAWLARQGMKHGFQFDDAQVLVQGYEVLRIEHRGPQVKIGVLDFEGTLEVKDPAALVPALQRGFGRAKSFGCGLMLVRRA